MIAEPIEQWVDTCEQCGHPIGWDRWVELPAGEILHRHCFEYYGQDEAERACERFAETFYGGDSPCTDDERYEAAAAERRRMDGL